MQYRLLGRRTGLRVSELALGTGNFGTGWGYGSEAAEAKAIFDRYTAAGGNFIDTADTYQAGQSEAMIGDFIAADRDHFVVASKYTMGVGPAAGPARTGNSRRTLIRAVEDSLKRLKTDRIDLYWAHFDDGMTPMEEILRGLDDLTRSGKILYAGLSNFPAWRIAHGAALADLRGWAPLIAVQIEYSLVQRTAERELLPMMEALGLGGALWSPLGGGFLTGKYRQGETGRLQGLGGILVHTESSSRQTAILDAVLEIATELGATPTEVAIAWVRHRAAISTTGLVPILGPRTLGHLDSSLSALKITLSADQTDRLTAVSAIDLGTPHDQIASVAAAVTGGLGDRLIRPIVPVV